MPDTQGLAYGSNDLRTFFTMGQTVFIIMLPIRSATSDLWVSMVSLGCAGYRDSELHDASRVARSFNARACDLGLPLEVMYEVLFQKNLTIVQARVLSPK